MPTFCKRGRVLARAEFDRVALAARMWGILEAVAEKEMSVS
jgi:hypothetical protein